MNSFVKAILCGFKSHSSEIKTVPAEVYSRETPSLVIPDEFITLTACDLCSSTHPVDVFVGRADANENTWLCIKCRLHGRRIIHRTCVFKDFFYKRNEICPNCIPLFDIGICSKEFAAHVELAIIKGSGGARRQLVQFLSNYDQRDMEMITVSAFTPGQLSFLVSQIKQVTDSKGVLKPRCFYSYNPWLFVLYLDALYFLGISDHSAAPRCLQEHRKLMWGMKYDALLRSVGALYVEQLEEISGREYEWLPIKAED